MSLARRLPFSFFLGCAAIATGCAAPVAPAGVGSQAPSASGTTSALKVGIIDAQKILETSAAGKKAAADLQEHAKLRQQLLDEDSKEIKKLESSLQAANSLSEAERKKRQAEHQKMYQEYQQRIEQFQRRTQEFERELAQKQQAAISEHRVKITAATKVVAEKRGLVAVFTKGNQGGDQIVYSAGFVDITGDVIAELDR